MLCHKVIVTFFHFYYQFYFVELTLITKVNCNIVIKY